MIGVKFSVFRFDGVEVREREFSIIKAGETSPVEPKAFRVLLFLLRNPQKLITKDELLNAVWGDTAVSENSLARSIALLRRLLGDDTHVPRYIETVATVGYRFVCPVEAVENARGGVVAAEPGGTAPNDQQAANEANRATAQAGLTPRRWWLAAAVVVGVGLLASAVWYLRRPLPQLHVTGYTQITHDGIRKYLAGTDGSRLYFDQRYDPHPISQVSVSGGAITPVPSALSGPGIYADDVSPDGSTLLVSSWDPVRGGLWSLQVLGGSLRHLADGIIYSAAWSPDGESAVYSTAGREIRIIRRDGTGAHSLTVAKGGAEHWISNLAWSPGGAIRFTMDNKLWEISPDGSGLHPLLPGWRPSSWQCCGHWTPDGKFYFFLLWDAPSSTYPNQAPLQFWVLDERRGLFRRSPAEPIQLSSGPISWDTPIPSKDGKKIFARGVILHGELVGYDARSHQLQPRLGGISAEDVAFSRDGRSVAYVTFPDGTLWKANRDGTDPVQLIGAPWYPNVPRWSPDGAQIAFDAFDAQGLLRSYILSSQGGSPHSILPEDKEFESDPNWSPDGKKIVFASGQFHTSTQNFHILDLANKQVTILPGSAGMYSPRWSPNGRFIAALDTRTWALTLFDFRTQRWSVLQKEPTGYPTWSHDGQFLYFLRVADDRGVYRMRTPGGTAERVVDLNGFRFTSTREFWMGLDPEDAPWLLRDTGTDDIFALTLENR